MQARQNEVAVDAWSQAKADNFNDNGYFNNNNNNNSDDNVDNNKNKAPVSDDNCRHRFPRTLQQCAIYKQQQ
jgi:hypothetical protein